VHALLINILPIIIVKIVTLNVILVKHPPITANNVVAHSLAQLQLKLVNV